MFTPLPTVEEEKSWLLRTRNIACGCVSYLVLQKGMGSALAQCMHIIRKAEKAWVPETTTTERSPSAPATTRNDTRYPGLSKATPRAAYGSGRLPLRPYVEDSTWGWVNRMTWDPHFGYSCPVVDDDGE